MDDKVIAAYKGITIQLQPRELRDGGWEVVFTLTEDISGETISTPYGEKTAFATRDIAKEAALESARRIIDEKH